MARNTVSVGLIVVFGLVVGWFPKPALAQQKPPSEAAGSNALAPASMKPGSTAAVDPKTYIIGAQDILMIKVWREPDFTGDYTVRPDGKITLPLLGDIQAGDLTPEKLSDQLKSALSDFINAPDISVSLQAVNSKRFFITGQVLRSGEYGLATPTRIFDALSNAGGFRDFANTKKIIIVRGSNRLKFNYQDILKGRNLAQNIYLENGDTVFVP